MSLNWNIPASDFQEDNLDHIENPTPLGIIEETAHSFML